MNKRFLLNSEKSLLRIVLSFSKKM